MIAICICLYKKKANERHRPFDSSQLSSGFPRVFTHGSLPSNHIGTTLFVFFVFLHIANTIMWWYRAMKDSIQIWHFQLKQKRAATLSGPRLKPEPLQGNKLTSLWFTKKSTTKQYFTSFTQVLRFRYVVTIYSSSYTVS